MEHSQRELSCSLRNWSSGPTSSPWSSYRRNFGTECLNRRNPHQDREQASSSLMDFRHTRNLRRPYRHCEPGCPDRCNDS